MIKVIKFNGVVDTVLYKYKPYIYLYSICKAYLIHFRQITRIA